MKSPLRILLIEDNPDDAELIQAGLEADKIQCEWVRVETRGDLITALDAREFDLILSDHHLPSFDGISALEIAHEKRPGTPFIFVSGTIGEECAIESLKRGATDYVLKQRLSRLAPSVRRAMEEFEQRAARRFAEQAWREADALFRSIFESTAVGMVVLDSNRGWTRTNGALQAMLGYDDAELSRIKPGDLAQDGDNDPEDGLFAKLFAGALPSYQVERTYRRKDGTPVWVRVTVSLIRASGKQPQFAVALIEDITERKKLEETLLHSQKMEAVGRLAAGIVHDFNNILTVLTGYSERLLSRLPEDDPSLREIRQIREAGVRGVALTKRLLGFSRKRSCQARELDPNSVIAGLEEMLRHAAGDAIRLTTVPGAGVGQVRIDETQLEQILINLVVNSRDAMSGGGDVTIASGSAQVDQRSAAENLIDAGEYVMLSVSDSGHGMDEKTRARIFEPFFTTKDIGKGTGLGLWTVHEIVRQGGGAILVESQPGAGATFRILLPRVTRLPGTAGLPEPPPPGRAGAGSAHGHGDDSGCGGGQGPGCADLRDARTGRIPRSSGG